ncbi:MAG: hypothetical protein JNL10_18940 [Verrucomicrobiales bacterium]|nr:hypothetical protein [Verrucomicrobiales bacterium]
MSGVELQYQLQKSVVVAVCLAAALIVGLFLVSAPFTLILAVFGVVWLFTLPYHSTLAIYVAMATLNSALIIPGVAGRPFVWEFATLLGWSGAVVTLALRRQAEGAGERYHRNRMVFIGIFGYCAVLLFIMYYRGVGIRALGGNSTAGQMGGRIYLQQIVSAILPVLLVINPLSERTLVRLFTLQCLMSITYLVSDFIFSFGGGPLFDLLLFLELPGDGINFELQSLRFGIRRFQSLFLFTQAMLLLLWVKRPFRDYTNRNALWMWPLTIALVAIGIFSGHRALVYTAGVTALVIAWSQRFFTGHRLVVASVFLAVSYFVAFSYVRDLPLSAQRALSIIPGLRVDRMADEDGRATFEGRITIRKIGWQLSKQYRWIGRGFGKMSDLDPAQYRFDMAYMHVDNGIFYNGTIGLLVNTGLPGTVFLFMLLAGGSVLAYRITARIRRDGAEDEFVRLAGLTAALWTANVLSFVILHGDAETALRAFALPAGLMIACDWHMRRRSLTPADVSVPVVQRPKIRERLPALEPSAAG